MVINGGYVIKTLLALHDQLDTTIAELDAKIAAAIAAIDPTPPPDPDHPDRLPLMDRLMEIPGVGSACAAAIIAEVGVDPTVFGKGNGWLTDPPQIRPTVQQVPMRTSELRIPRQKDRCFMPVPTDRQQINQIVQSTEQVGGWRPKTGGRDLDGRAWDEMPRLTWAGQGIFTKTAPATYMIEQTS